MNHERAVNQHYGRDDLARLLLEALAQAGKDIENLTVDDLGPIEEFHIGGRKSTFELASLTPINEDSRVLDLGCGIGGPARALAERFGCTVTGIDLTEEYCAAGATLTRLTGLADRVEIRHGSALDIPSAQGTFDLVWMQHVSMNIDDKDRLFGEIARVLRPRGRLALTRSSPVRNRSRTSRCRGLPAQS
jgi:ubiquinone/menaquinone biosynthesis C-methylase UbiE